jgi:acetolactate synthase small subunit
LSIRKQPEIETEKIESLKKALNKLQEELTVQKTITDAVSEQNLKLKTEIVSLTKGHSALEKRVDEMTTMFRTTFVDLMKASAETTTVNVEKTKTRKRGKKPEGAEQAEKEGTR